MNITIKFWHRLGLLMAFTISAFFSLMKRMQVEIIRWSHPLAPMVETHRTAMATFRRWFSLALLQRGGLAALIALLFGFGLNARAQVLPIALFPVTNMPVTLASNVVNCATNPAGQLQIIPLTKNCCLSFGGRCNISSAAGITGTEVVSGSFSQDGTNFGCAPFTLTANLTTALPTNTFGIPTNSVWTNWSQAYLSGFAAVAITQVTNTGQGIATNYNWAFQRPTLNVNTY